MHFHHALVALVLALNVYLVGRGVAALRRPLPAPLEVVAFSRTQAEQTRRDATAVLRRNAFDSVTGPLHVAAISLPRLIPPPADPLEAPPCERVVVLATAEFEDPRASTALLRGPGDERGYSRRVGDRVGDGVVVFIGVNPRAGAPTVWVENQERLCQSQLFRSGAQHAAPERARPASPAPEQRRRARSGLPDELARKIRRLSPTLVQVDRSIVDRLARDYPQLTRGARVRVAREGGRPVGVQLRRIRSNGLLAHLGFEPRDRVERLNGLPLKSPHAFRDALASSTTASQLRVELTRGGKPMVLELAIR